MFAIGVYILRIFHRRLSSVLITKLISEVDKYHVCIGNPDTKFVEMLKSYKAKQILDRSRSIVVAFLDQKGILHNGTYYHSTVRAVSCPIVTKAENPKCTYCTDYRRNLRSLYSRYEKKSCSSQTSTNTYTNIRFLTTPERRQTISKLRKVILALKRQIDILQRNIEKCTLVDGVSIDNQLSSDMVSIMEDSHHDIIKSYPADSF